MAEGSTSTDLVKLGASVYLSLVTRETLEGDMRGLGNERLYALTVYVKTLPNATGSGVPVLIRSLVTMEKERRWDDGYCAQVGLENAVEMTGESDIEKLPPGATSAEGIDSADGFTPPDSHYVDPRSDN